MMSQGQMQTRLAWSTVRPRLKENLRRTLSDSTGNGNSYCVVFLVSVGNVLKSALLDHSSSTPSLVFVDGITAGVNETFKKTYTRNIRCISVSLLRKCLEFLLLIRENCCMHHGL